MNCTAGLAPADLEPTSSPPKGWVGLRVGLVWADVQGRSWPHPSLCADLHIGGAAIHESLTNFTCKSENLARTYVRVYCHKLEIPESSVYEVRVLHELTGQDIAGFGIWGGVNLLLSTPLYAEPHSYGKASRMETERSPWTRAWKLYDEFRIL